MSGVAEEGRRIVVLSGPSGSGKTTIVERLMAEPPVPLQKSVSATTRPMREGETNGEDYWFLPDEEFQARRRDGEFLEVAEVHKSGFWYGTLCSEIKRATDQSRWAFLEIDVEGALNVMREYPEAVTIFLTTPSLEEYESRLRRRGTETDDIIRRRLETTREELKLADRYQYQVINDDLDRAVEDIAEILTSRETELHA